MPQIENVKKYFERDASRFDAIYSDNKSLLQILRDKLSRKVIAKRFDFTFKAAGTVKDKSVLDIGCGSGRYSIEFAKKGAREVLGLDFSANMIELAKTLAFSNGKSEVCNFVCDNFLKMHIDKRYNISVAMGLFDYLAEPGVYLRKIAGVTSDTIVASFPKKWHWLSLPRKIRLSLRDCPVYFYGQKKLKKLIRLAGIKDFSIHSLSRDYIVVAHPSVKTEKKKVLHIITRLILGGAQENTLLTVEGLSKKPEYDVTLISGPQKGPEGDLSSRAREHNIKVLVVPELVRNINPIKDIMALFKLYFLIKKYRFDIVHTHSSKAGITGRLAAYWAQTPVIVHTLHSLVFHEYQNRLANRFYIFLKKIAARHTDKFISVADFITEKAIACGIAAKDKFITIRSGMELDRFLEIGKIDAEKIKESLGIGPDCLVVGKIGRLFQLKGHEYVIDAMPKIIEKFPKVKFLFVGDGILRDDLRKRAERLGVAESIVFAGLVKRDDVPKYISAMDVVVHTSLREGLARVIPQAMAAGKPVVSFDVDGAAEVIIDGKTGRLVPPKDIDALKEAILDLLTDKDKRRVMGQNGRQCLGKEFGVEIMVEKIDNLYKDLLSAKHL